MNKIKISKKEYTKLFYDGFKRSQEDTSNYSTSIYIDTNTGKLSLHRCSSYVYFDLILIETISNSYEIDCIEDLEDSFNQEYFWNEEDLLNEDGHQFKFEFID